MSETTLIDRAVIRLSGEDVRPFLQGLVTQDVLTLKQGEARWAGVLAAQGTALFDFLLWGDGEDIHIDCEAAQNGALIRRISLTRMRRKIGNGRGDSWAVHWSSHEEKHARRMECGRMG